MLKIKGAFSGFSVKDTQQAKSFYIDILGLKVEEDTMGLTLHLPGSDATVFVYQKENHQPATFTVLNLAVDDIDVAVETLESLGVIFEKYEGLGQDERGVARGKANNMGPDIAWFKDPSGNIMSVLQN